MRGAGEEAEGFEAGRPMRSESKNLRQGLIRAQVKAGKWGSRGGPG